MEIRLASCNKRKNSTIINGIWDMTKECSLKNPTSVMNPVVTIYDTTDRMQKFNYAYIPDFNRYYFIDDIIYEDTGNVTLTMSIDVLASYRDEIANSNIYYLRGPQNVANGYIVDSLFPITTKARTYSDTFSTIETTATNLDNGYYILITAGVMSATGTTGQTIYQLTPAKMKEAVNALMSLADSTDFGNLAQGVKNSIFSPLDYVAACYWSPVGFQLKTVQNLCFGKWNTGISCDVLNGTPKRFNYDAMVRTQINFTNNQYLMQKPYSRYIVSFGLVPDFEIDGSLLYDGLHNIPYLRIYNTVDPASGIAILEGYPAYMENGVIYERTSCKLFTMQCNYMVPINISSVKNNMLDAGGNAISGLLNAIGGNPLSAIGEFLSAGITAAENVITGGTVSNVGGNGSLSKHYVTKKLLTQFFSQVDVDHTNKGYPCCKLTSAKNGGYGYYQGMNVSLFLSTATREETQLAETIIESGYFYQ